MNSAACLNTMAAVAPVNTDVIEFRLEEAARIVDAIPADRHVVLLGESTHGTEEFYRLRFEVCPLGSDSHDLCASSLNTVHMLYVSGRR
jgi:hypothetical protein